MNANFADTNIIIYSISTDEDKQQKALRIIAQKPVISTALKANCTTLYSEDMQNGQLIENKPLIVNPFK